METIFKSAVNKIKAEENIKRKTEEYLMEKLSAAPSSSTPVRMKRPMMKRVIAAACTAVFLCATSIGAYAYYKTPVSYLSLDINPSVELGVNTFGRIISVIAYNSDGQTIIEGQNVTGLDVKDAVRTLVRSAAQKGFIAEDGSTIIAVTSETDNSAVAEELQSAAEQGAASAVELEGDTASVVKENVALERRDEARKLGITPGKLNLIQKLQALDPSITVDEYKDSTVTEIIEKFVELKKEKMHGYGSNDSSSSVNEGSESASQASQGESRRAAAAQSNTNNSKANQNAASNSGRENSASGNVKSRAANGNSN